MDRPVYLIPRLSFSLFRTSPAHIKGVLLSEKPGERCKLHRGQTSCLDAGGTLATRLNSNYACMGLPPDDMIGILTQTDIQNRIREEPNKRHLIQRCSCVISFTNAFSPFFPPRSGLHHFGIQSLYKVFAPGFFRPHFPDLNALCLA